MFLFASRIQDRLRPLPQTVVLAELIAVQAADLPVHPISAPPGTDVARLKRRLAVRKHVNGAEAAGRDEVARPHHLTSASRPWRPASLRLMALRASRHLRSQYAVAVSTDSHAPLDMWLPARNKSSC